MKLSVQIDEEFRDMLSEEWLSRVVEETLSDQKVGPQAELSVSITGDETMRSLNLEYRGLDETTDVLSFALTEEHVAEGIPAFVTPPDDLLHLGEVIISYPQARRQAGEGPVMLEKELALLTVHGILHLLGHDHDEPDREREMKAVEERVLSSLKISEVR